MAIFSDYAMCLECGNLQAARTPGMAEASSDMVGNGLNVLVLKDPKGKAKLFLIFYDSFTGKNQSTACLCRDANACNAGLAAALPARKPLTNRYYPFVGSEVWETSSHSCCRIDGPRINELHEQCRANGCYQQGRSPSLRLWVSHRLLNLFGS